MLFVGTYENKVDAKCRVSLPAAFREQISKGEEITKFYIFKSPNLKAIEAGDHSLMESIAKSIEQDAPMFSQNEDWLSYIISSAREVTCDSTGRFTLPSEFMSFANITDKAVFVGRARRFQICNPDEFAQRSKIASEKFIENKLSIRKAD